MPTDGSNLGLGQAVNHHLLISSDKQVPGQEPRRRRPGPSPKSGTLAQIHVFPSLGPALGQVSASGLRASLFLGSRECASEVIPGDLGAPLTLSSVGLAGPGPPEPLLQCLLAP